MASSGCADWMWLVAQHEGGAVVPTVYGDISGDIPGFARSSPHRDLSPLACGVDLRPGRRAFKHEPLRRANAKHEWYKYLDLVTLQH